MDIPQTLRTSGIALYDRLTRRNTLSLLDDLNRTQWLSADELKALQLRKLQSLLQYAYTHVPHYRRVFDEVGFRPDDLERDPDSFQQIPPVSKSYIRAHMDQFLTSDPVMRMRLSQESTSGSTGEPFSFWVDKNAQSYSVSSAFRHHMWMGWQPGQPCAYLWGIPYVRSFKSRLKESARNLLWNRFFVNGYSLSKESMSQLAQLLKRRQPSLLVGYASAIYFFARFVQEQGWEDVKVPSVCTSTEVLYPFQRAGIEETLGCQVFNRYATEEIGGVACECERHAGMHISVETTLVEILDRDNQPVRDGEEGNVVVTNLGNYGLPFIRYRLEDIGRMSTEPCSCGRGQPLLAAIEGRQMDMFKTRDGRYVKGFDRAYRNLEGVDRYQIIQKSLDHILVRMVKAEPLTQAQQDKTEETMRLVLGDHIQIQYEYTDEIPTTRSGKFRYTICEVE